jgi:hypothetical protein
MNEAEWLACLDPLDMVNVVGGSLTDRKLRLLLVACCRRLGHLFAGGKLPEALGAAERFADGSCGEKELNEAARAVREAVASARQRQGWPLLALTGASRAAAIACARPGALGRRIHHFVGRYSKWSYAVMTGLDVAAEAVAHGASEEVVEQWPISFEQALADERREQCRLLREIAGNPFRPARVDPEWLAWNNAAVVRLAESVYREQAFDRLPILADALEEAGADDAEVLEHLRGPGPHARGYWLIDLLTGRG